MPHEVLLLVILMAGQPPCTLVLLGRRIRHTALKGASFRFLLQLGQLPNHLPRILLGGSTSHWRMFALLDCFAPRDCEEPSECVSLQLYVFVLRLACCLFYCIILLYKGTMVLASH